MSWQQQVLDMTEHVYTVQSPYERVDSTALYTIIEIFSILHYHIDL